MLLQRLRPERSVAERVRAHLAPALTEGEPQESLIARQLGMSPRTLQRYLRAEGVTFGKILDEVRRELALHYLRDRTLGVTAVAFLLGYSDPSTFFRAFRRWTGTTPHKMAPPASRATLWSAICSPIIRDCATTSGRPR